MKYFTDRFKAVFLLLILLGINVSCLSCFPVCSLQHRGHLLGKDWPLGSLVCDVFLYFVTFPCGVIGQAWFLIVSVLDLCLLTYFYYYYYECCLSSDFELALLLHSVQ